MHATYGWGPITPAVFYTTYTYCNGNPINNYYKFYGADSICMIDNNIPQPPPYSFSISYQFYGEKISNLLTNIIIPDKNDQIIIYPNPSSGILNIDFNEPNNISLILITDLLGREVKKESMQLDKEAQINVSELKEGIYFIRIETSKGIFNKKLIIN